jgi:hypothetical protein
MVQGGGVGLSKDFQQHEPNEDDCNSSCKILTSSSNGDT